MVIVIRKAETLAVVNLRSKSVDCMDDYTRMRLLGLMEGLIADPAAGEMEE